MFANVFSADRNVPPEDVHEQSVDIIGVIRIVLREESPQTQRTMNNSEDKLAERAVEEDGGHHIEHSFDDN